MTTPAYGNCSACGDPFGKAIKRHEHWTAFCTSCAGLMNPDALVRIIRIIENIVTREIEWHHKKAHERNSP